MAQLAEHILGKDEVDSSTLSSSSRKWQIPTGICHFQLNPPLRVDEILLCNMKYACGVWNSPRRRVGGFNFTWCGSIKFHNSPSELFRRERKRTISLNPQRFEFIHKTSEFFIVNSRKTRRFRRVSDWWQTLLKNMCSSFCTDTRLLPGGSCQRSWLRESA